MQGSSYQVPERLLAAVLAFGAAQGVWAADQYWVGGASGLWSGDNWADAADGTGAAWTNGSRSVFTTTPAAVDLAGFSPTATYLTGSGFSNGNLCKISVTNSSETVPTLTLTSAGSDFTVASFTNVNVHCTATGNFGLNNSSHLYFGEGSKFTMAGGGRFLVGNSISCSNSLVVAVGAKATVSKAFWIGCGSQNSLHPIGVVHVAGGELTVNESIFMSRHTSTADNHWKYGNGGTGVLWVESGTCNVNGEIISNGAAFKATSITFAAGCSKVTIEGVPLVGIEAINNLSSANHEFKAAVSGDVVTISNTTTYCVFSGGLTANGVSFGTQACLAGSTLKFSFTERGTAPKLVFSQAMGTMFAVRAANYNVRCKTSEGDSTNNWDNRKADFVNLVKNIAPDVIGFQEVMSAQYSYLKGQLSGYEFYGRYRDDSSSSEACPIAYPKSRFTFLEGGTFWLSSTPNVVGSKAWGDGIGNSGYPRICTWALLKDKASGGVFCFTGTHLDLNAGPRLAGMRLILSSLVERYDAVDVPIVLVGDMNAVETEESMLAATAVMQDSLLASKSTPTGSWRTYNAFSWKSSEVSNADALANYTAAERTSASSTLGSRIDYIFASHGIDVESFATRNDARPGKQYYPSDHYPVAADLRLPYANNLYGGKVRIEIDKSVKRVNHGRYVLTRVGRICPTPTVLCSCFPPGSNARRWRTARSSSTPSPNRSL